MSSPNRNESMNHTTNDGSKSEQTSPGALQPLMVFLKHHKAIVLLFLLVQIPLGVLLARAYLLVHNTLHENGFWISTKALLEKPVLGSHAYVFDRQALAENMLHLGAWHGYQEVIYKNPLELKSFECDIKLTTPQAYLAIILQQDVNGFAGIRFSATPDFPSMAFQADASGGFTKKTQLSIATIEEDVWHHIKLMFAQDITTIFLDHRELGIVSHIADSPQSIGFRGGYWDAVVDNIILREHDSGTFSESFDNRRKALPVILTFSLLVGLGNTILLFLLSVIKRIPGQRMMFLVLLVNIILVPVVSFIYGYLYLIGAFYPKMDAELQAAEHYWRDFTKESIVRNVSEQYAERPESTVYRILFLGSSQTWGAGTAKAEDVFPAVLERQLNARFGSAEVQFECINAGISAARSTDIAPLYEERWMRLNPKVVMINLGTNDQILHDFYTNLEKIITLSLNQGSIPVLILEANTIEADDRNLRERHDVMRRLAQQYRVPLIDMHAYLKIQYDTGFVWWDFVHLTSFGQKLVAQKLFDELQPFLTQELDRAAHFK